VFGSRRTQALQIYKQAYNGNTPPQLLTQGTELDFYNARVAPDGASLILAGVVQGSTGFGFYRVPIDGGAPQLLFKIEGNDSGDFRCTIQPVNLCVYGLFSEDRKELRVVSFPQPGVDARELLRIPVEPGAEYHWGMSPDGSWIGIEKSYWNANQIRFVPVRGGETRNVTVQGYTYLQSFDWAQDSKSVFVATYSPGGSVLLHVGLDGSVQPIWRQAQSSRTWGIPSPDGRHITMFGTSREANVWLLENF
jgi:Tol biopolymer transport system component